MVRRLVEQEDVRVTCERPSQRGARQFSAGEGRERSAEVAIRETQTTDDPGDALPPGIAAGMLEARLCIGVPMQRVSAVVSPGHRFLEAPQLPLGGEARCAREGILEQRQAALRRGTLIVEGDAGALLEGKLAAVDLGLAREHPQQRRLARTVRARERDPPTTLELERHAVEERRAGDLLAEVRCDQDCHPVKGSAWLPWLAALTARVVQLPVVVSPERS